ncbi:MAG: tRNA dihydrouridine synthase DusB [Armatimonadetes bacterium]|nr:tRNA dihydrouridine synthase DusB [Armatimonadota bacterium]
MIGDIRIWPPLVLAPMAGATNHAFRLLARECGDVGLVVCEMISSYGLYYNNERTLDMFDWTDAERPVSVQIFGAVPEIVAEAARKAEDAGVDMIDINMGCWVPKVVRTGACAALLKDLKQARAVIEACVNATSLPVTVKTRKGWDLREACAVDVARIAEDAGVKAITIHGRAASQGFNGQSDSSVIAEVKQAVSIPVIGNGDIRTVDDVERMFRETGCDGVMLGRSALGNPFIFREVWAWLDRGERTGPPTAQERARAALRHTVLQVEALGEERGIREMRGLLPHYIKGLENAARIRHALTQVRTVADVQKLLSQVAELDCEHNLAERAAVNSGERAA